MAGHAEVPKGQPCCTSQPRFPRAPPTARAARDPGRGHPSPPLPELATAALCSAGAKGANRQSTVERAVLGVAVYRVAGSLPPPALQRTGLARGSLAMSVSGLASSKKRLRCGRFCESGAGATSPPLTWLRACRRRVGLDTALTLSPERIHARARAATHARAHPAPRASAPRTRARCTGRRQPGSLHGARTLSVGSPGLRLRIARRAPRSGRVSRSSRYIRRRVGEL